MEGLPLQHQRRRQVSALLDNPTSSLHLHPQRGFKTSAFSLWSVYKALWKEDVPRPPSKISSPSSSLSNSWVMTPEAELAL